MFEVVKWMSDSGLSTTDTIGLEASVMIISIKLLANRSAQLTDLTCRLEELCLILNIDERVIDTIAKRNTRKSLIMFFIGLVSSYIVFLNRLNELNFLLSYHFQSYLLVYVVSLVISSIKNTFKCFSFTIRITINLLLFCVLFGILEQVVPMWQTILSSCLFMTTSFFGFTAPVSIINHLLCLQIFQTLKVQIDVWTTYLLKVYFEIITWN
jgi:hypothetical protein